MTSADIERIAASLDAIADELADAAITELISAAGRGEKRRPDVERAITQARRAVDKASHLLRRASTGTSPADHSHEFD